MLCVLDDEKLHVVIIKMYLQIRKRIEFQHPNIMTVCWRFSNELQTLPDAKGLTVMSSTYWKFPETSQIKSGKSSQVRLSEVLRIIWFVSQFLEPKQLYRVEGLLDQI